MPYLIRLQPPKGPAEYIPPGFGFTAHAHVTDPAAAAQFDTESAAARRMHAYLWPPAFWESERRHRAAQEAKFRNWKCEIVAA